MKSLKQDAKAEKQEYCQLKKLRWSLLTNSYKLSDSKTDYQQAVIGWTKWFQAAKESEIPALVRFAVQKEK